MNIMKLIEVRDHSAQPIFLRQLIVSLGRRRPRWPPPSPPPLALRAAQWLGETWWNMVKNGENIWNEFSASQFSTTLANTSYFVLRRHQHTSKLIMDWPTALVFLSLVLWLASLKCFKIFKVPGLITVGICWTDVLPVLVATEPSNCIICICIQEVLEQLAEDRLSLEVPNMSFCFSCGTRNRGKDLNGSYIFIIFCRPVWPVSRCF